MSKETDTKAQKLLDKSAKGVTFLVFGQFFTKLSTFILNQILISYISPTIFGINAFLEFLINTTLFFAREGIRLSSQRIKDHNDLTINEEKDSKRFIHGTSKGIDQSIINVSYIPLLIGIPLSTVIMYWQYGNISDYFTHMEFFGHSLLIIWFAIIIELLSEPVYILNQFHLNYDKRTRYESLAITASCIVNFTIIFNFKDDESLLKNGLPILAFAIGKLTHSIVLLVLYYWDFKSVKSTDDLKINLTVTKIYSNSSSNNYYYFDKEIVNHFYKIIFQICFKHLLTEGDKLVINSLCTIEEQGIYSLISNYGSLIARLIFAPVEESLRNFLTRLSLNKSNQKLSLEILTRIITFYIYLSIIIVIFGPLNSSYLIQKLIGNNWSNVVAQVIPLYTLYLPLLAFNGILEATHQSIASGDEIVNYTYFMIGFSGIFMVSSFLTIKNLNLSLYGLILSNMLNMLLRIVYCTRFILKYFQKPISQLIKIDGQIIFSSLLILSLDLMFFGITRNLLELFGNVVFAGLLVSFILYKEKALILSIIKRNPVQIQQLD